MLWPIRQGIIGARSAVDGALGSINFDFTTGSLPGAITFTRASSGSYFNSSNVLQVYGASTNAARFDYMASGSTRTLLYEPAATNLFLQSNAFSTTWVPSAVTLVAAAFTSPDGTADGWSAATTNASYGYITQYFTALNIPYTISLWAKAISGSNQSVVLVAGTGDSPGGIFTPTSTDTRYAHTATLPAGAGSQYIQIGYGTPNTFGIFGAQIEATPSSLSTPGPTSYIPTTAANVTRAADVATFTIPFGIGHLTVTFDDNSTQSIAVSPGSYTLTTALNRLNIKTIVGVA